MFANLGRAVSRYAAFWIAAWVLIVGGVSWVAPAWNDVTQPGEFQFLPADAPSRQGTRLFERAFPNDLLGSSVVLVVHRRDGRPLSESDHRFVETTLRPRLLALAEKPSNGSNESADDTGESPRSTTSALGRRPTNELIVGVRTPADEGIGELLRSPDRRAELVIVELRTEFLEHANREVVNRIAVEIEQLREDGQVPQDISIATTGGAAVGRDFSEAEAKSAEATEYWTVVLVVTLLIVVFRAPLLAVVPLLTLFMGFKLALNLLAIAADLGWIGLFRGIDTYTMVVVYGAGVDYSLFLSARVQEELSAGKDAAGAVSTAVERVGSAIAASSGTEIFGIGMLVFASFGKLHQAGITIAFGLAIMLAAALTLTPSLLRLGSPWIYFPQTFGVRERKKRHSSGPMRAVSWIFQQNVFEDAWERVGRLFQRRPGMVFVVTVLIMSVPAAWGVWNRNQLSYGLISQLSPTSPSVEGMETLKKYFPEGETGHVTLLIEDNSSQTDTNAFIRSIQQFSDRLMAQKDELQIADIRSVAEPLGVIADRKPTDSVASKLELLARRSAMRRDAIDHYISDAPDISGLVTRMDIVLDVDPFSRESIAVLDRVEQAARENLPQELAADSKIYFIGPTASIRDLQQVAGRDRTVIHVLVVLSVWVVLMLLVRSIPLSVYLMLTVIFSYLVTLGITYTFFWALDPAGFDGLDWTVPLFLFTILVAVGIDYNIFLVSRIADEQKERPPVEGIITALTKTGAIISGCGLIMAGTFSSLMVGGELARMDQLGFALAVGIIIDTFLIRPAVVPLFLILVADGGIGLPKKWFSLGAVATLETQSD